jgi:hypothetical protein
MTPQQENTLCICGDVDCVVSFGKCHCLCGETTSVSKVTRNIPGHIKGRHVKFMRGHGGSKHQREVIEGPTIDGDECVLIKLTKGQWAITLKSDKEKYGKHLWYAHGRHGRYYAARKVEINGKHVRSFMHREVLGLSTEDRRDPDHENGNTLDNRPRNLRPSSSAQNSQNKPRRKDNTSGYKGVSWHKRLQKWQAEIMENGRKHFLGYFYTKEEAYAAYCKAALFYHKEFARVA